MYQWIKATGILLLHSGVVWEDKLLSYPFLFVTVVFVMSVPFPHTNLDFVVYPESRIINNVFMEIERKNNLQIHCTIGYITTY